MLKTILSAVVILLGCPLSRPILAQSPSSLKPGSVATVAGTAISEEELLRAISGDLFKLEMQRLQSEANYERGRYQIRENALRKMVEDRLLDAEAVKRSITRVELIAQEIDRKAQVPTEAEVDTFYESNKARINRPKEQVLPQIRQYLMQQSSSRARAEFIDRIKVEYKVNLPLEPFRLRVESAGHPSKGPAQAPVTLVEFSDFECSFCRQYTTILEQLLKDFNGEIRLVFRQFPLVDIHPNAQKAAEASLCASDQGKFWEMHDLLFQDPTRLSIADLKAKAATLGLDAGGFNACLDSGRYAKQITQDLRDGARAGVTGTPALFINGRPFTGVQPAEELTNVINQELKLMLDARMQKP